MSVGVLTGMPGYQHSARRMSPLHVACARRSSKFLDVQDFAAVFDRLTKLNYVVPFVCPLNFVSLIIITTFPGWISFDLPVSTHLFLCHHLKEHCLSSLC